MISEVQSPECIIQHADNPVHIYVIVNGNTHIMDGMSTIQSKLRAVRIHHLVSLPFNEFTFKYLRILF